MSDTTTPTLAPTLAPTPAPTLAEMTEAIYQINHANGWYETDRTIGDDLALLHSEVSEMLEAYRSHGLADVTDHNVYGSHRQPDRLPKPEGVGSEMADVLIRLLDTARRHPRILAVDGILYADPGGKRLNDLPARPFPSGRVTFGDKIAYLHWVIVTVPWFLLRTLVAMAAEYDIDLQAECDRKIAYNATRGHRHGGKRL